MLLPAAARWDHPSWVEDRTAMVETGVRILRLLTSAVTAEPVSPLPVHEQLAAAWHVPADRAPLIRAALVLSADHEFNASAFAARVVASTGANLHGSRGKSTPVTGSESGAQRSVSKDGNPKDGIASIVRCIGIAPVATLRDTPLRSVPQGEVDLEAKVGAYESGAPAEEFAKD